MRLRLALLKLFMALGTSCVLAQTPQSTHWHLPLDRDAWEVRVVSDSAEVMVPSIQPMATWNRPSTLRPKNNGFDGIAVIGEARQIVGDFRASSTAVGLGTSGTMRNRGSYRVAASRWRIPLGFPLAREVADHGSMDGLGTAILMKMMMQILWPCLGPCRHLSASELVRRRTTGVEEHALCFWTVTWPLRLGLDCGLMRASFNMLKR